ncbi:hypothetical protein [Hyphomicrobium sp.]|uniref:hypothetical protein n=1 Tax=Hyphomicrobium sp. TaxID=82 RepID=UPI001D540268|nr:hypothetical protein [Hyphomicrobium sp.]MBY0560583.1 hypothetical protein [Hyphomicrobium sp.]
MAIQPTPLSDEAALPADLAAPGYPRLEEDLIAALARERRGSTRNQAIAMAKVCLNFRGELMFSSVIGRSRVSPGSRSFVAGLSVWLAF